MVGESAQIVPPDARVKDDEVTLRRARDAKYDADPEALAWARDRVQRQVERMERFEQQARERGSSNPEQWRRFAVMLRRDFIGGEGCVIASFDERRARPELHGAIYGHARNASAASPAPEHP